MMTATRLDATAIKDQARGKWRGILTDLGTTLPATAKQHGPCPTCGGTDRFRFDDQDGNGTWFCNQCRPQAGDGFALVMKVQRVAFPEALRIVAGVLGLDSTICARRQRPLSPPVSRIDRRAIAFRFELAALDLRLRAERIMEAGKRLNADSLNDDNLDRALGHVAQVHTDIQRAELFEGVADDLRMKEFVGKDGDHAQRKRAA